MEHVLNKFFEQAYSSAEGDVGGLSRMALFSKKDILAGEEICYDYNFSLFDSDQVN